jgi:uncharacterized membrane protein
LNVDALRRTWREGRSPSLRRRRQITALCAVGLVDFAAISLLQVGALRRLPDPPGRLFDSVGVNTSRKAFASGLPDGPLGALQYAAMMALAAWGGRHSTGKGRIRSLLLGAVALGGAVAGLDYLRDMLFKQKRVCPYCLLGAALNLAMVPLALREARNDAVR